MNRRTPRHLTAFAAATVLGLTGAGALATGVATAADPAGGSTAVRHPG